MGPNFPISPHHPRLHNHRDRHPILRQILLQLLRPQIRPPLALPRQHLPRRRRTASRRRIRKQDENRDDRDAQGTSQDLDLPRNHLLPDNPRRKSHAIQPIQTFQTSRLTGKTDPLLPPQRQTLLAHPTPNLQRHQLRLALLPHLPRSRELQPAISLVLQRRRI
jgi:hypothetical protein